MPTIETILWTVPRPAQSQASLSDQMVELRRLAQHFGLYDADDWIMFNYFAHEPTKGNANG